MIFSTVDVVTFSLVGESIHVLLHERAHEPFIGKWALPGVEVRPEVDSSVEDAAIRAIEKKGGITPAYLEQLGVFSGPGRDPRGWSQSCAFLALVHEGDFKTIGMSQRWVEASQIKKENIPFDHYEIIQAARSRLKAKTSYSTVSAYLAGCAFTLPRLQKIFEICKEEAIDKVTFRRRIENSNIIEKAEGQFDYSSKRPAQLYRIKKTSSLKGGFSVEFFDRDF